MQILMTGANGFVGSHLSCRLLGMGHKVHAIVRHHPTPSKISNQIATHTGDLLDIYSLKKIIAEVQPECIIHLAAMTPVRHSFENPFIYAETNLIGTMNLTIASQKSHILEKFILASTAEVYKADTEKIITEEDELYGSTPYGVSKVAADYWVRVAGDCYGLPYIILRPSNTYGRKTEKGYFIEKVITTMLTSDKLELDGTPDLVRDWMFIDDHVEGYVKAVESNCTGEVFNISTSYPNSTGAVVGIAREITGWDGEVRWGMHPRPFEPKYLLLSNEKAKRKLGFAHRVSLVDGLKEVVKYWETQ